MGELFDVTVSTINEHLKNIFESHELDQNSVIRKFLITASDEKNYNSFKILMQLYLLSTALTPSEQLSFANGQLKCCISLQ